MQPPDSQDEQDQLLKAHFGSTWSVYLFVRFTGKIMKRKYHSWAEVGDRLLTFGPYTFLRDVLAPEVFYFILSMNTAILIGSLFDAI